MADGQSSPEALRRLAERQGVEASDEDLDAVHPFLDAILPELERLEAELELDETP